MPPHPRPLSPEAGERGERPRRTKFALRGITVSAAATPDQVRQARERLDAHVREIVEWHFNPDTGTPFWLEKAKSYKFDPRKDVKGFDDLKKFGLFEDEWLRGGPVRRWVPKALAKKPIYVFETGGTTGIPKSRVVSDDF